MMRAFFSPAPVLLQMSLQGGIVIILILLSQCLYRGRLQPRWRYTLWLLVLLRLGLPWTIPSPLSIFGVLRIPAPAAEPLPQTTATLAANGADPAEPELSYTPVASPNVHWLTWL